MPNIDSYIQNHKVLTNKINEVETDNCNCHNKDTCPLPNCCQTKSIIYQANVDGDIARYRQKCYLGSYGRAFKGRFQNHKLSFKYI